MELEKLITSRKRMRKRSAVEQIIETKETEATFTALDPGSQFMITVKSMPEKGVVPFKATYKTWTLPTYMRPPRRPKFINATDSTLTVFLYGVSAQEADIKSYQVMTCN